MKKLLAVLFLIFSFLGSTTLAHEVDENRAKISIHHQSVYLTLHLHESKWTQSFPIHKLDDEILKNTLLSVNKKNLPLRLKKIEKKANHYHIQYLATTKIDSKVNNADLTLPKELEKVVVTIIRAHTKMAYNGSKTNFSFK